MTRALFCTLLLAATGCPPPTQSGGTGPQPVEAEVGCPSGSDVYVASYLSAEPGKGHTGWVLPVRDEKADSVKGMPEFEEIAPGASPPLEMPRLPVWILQPGIAPCRTTIGKPYRAAIDVASAPNLSYGYELDGCGAPADPEEDEAVVVASTGAPGQCQLVTPHPVSARVGDIDAQKMWTPPKKQTPIPPQIAPLVPQHACAEPGCQEVWSFLQVDVGIAPVAWSGAVNWMQAGATPAPLADVCKWPLETFSGFFVPGPGGAAVKVESGQDHPLVLTAVLADHGGAKVLLADGAGEYSTYDLAPDGAHLARHLVWLIAEPAAYGVDDRVGPVCDPNATAGGLGSGPPPPPATPPPSPSPSTLKPLSEPAHPE
jgi:hypothetical protein